MISILMKSCCTLLLLLMLCQHGFAQESQLVDSETIKQHIRAANRFNTEKKYEQAKKEYDFLIASSPKDVEFYISRGYVELSLKQYAAAIADAKRVSALSKFNGHLYSAARLHAKAAAGLNNTNEAIKQYLLASERFSGNADDQFELGKLYLREKRYDEALVCLQKASDKYSLASENERVKKLADESNQLITQTKSKISEMQRKSKSKKVD
jgi:tetratricopeptide (TPR) repeat protein